MLRRLCLALAAALAGGVAAAGTPTEASSDAPARVVSMNLCADQIALMLAAPGQLVSVSRWAQRPEASNLAEEARRLPANDGLAEQVFLMRPDLVLAGRFTNPAAREMLSRLGVRVEIVPSARSLDDVPEIIATVGALLGREAEAEALTGEFHAMLDAAAARAEGLPREDAAYHYPNNYTSGDGTLAAEAMEAAQFDNAAAKAGLSGAARIELESLVMLKPFLIRSQPISGAETGRAYESGEHPALEALRAQVGGATVEERWQVCGTPYVVRAIDALVAARTQ